ncbi:UvrD-helicase domain-containing protein [Candidatus Kaiserbacteria bacterium]|nr:UvrD-helicase domain-containing protein [Candidatus Kaiserbacteria bacterium]
MPPYLIGLNPGQKEAVLYQSGPLLIIAGAGAGKTKTITHRLAHLAHSGVPAHRLLAVTFTNKAAGEMRERVEKLMKGGDMPFVSTFHSLSVRLLREFAESAGLSRHFAIWDRDDSIRAIKTLLKEGGYENRYNPRAILSAISKAKSKGTDREGYEASAHTSFDSAVLHIWERYEGKEKDEDALDFDDLLIRTLELLQNNDDILQKLRARWTHITIDEYQDTNSAQYEIARLLAGDEKNICAVGDIDQNIYSWRGADITHLLTFEKTYPGTKVVLLEQNYRSTKTILTAANSVIALNKRRYAKNLFTENETGEAITLFSALDEKQEARFVAERARELIASGTPPPEIAVLYRENFQSRALEEACIEMGLPYRVLGTRFFERAEIKDLLSYLRAALNPRSKNDLARIVSSPPRGIGKQTLEKMLGGDEISLSPAAKGKISAFRTSLARMREKIQTTKASDAVHFALTESGMETFFQKGDEEDLERLANVRELVSLATKYDALPPPEGIERLLEDAALMSEQDSLETSGNAISLMTAHASKGLEFDVVFVTGLEQGLFPSVRESNDRDEEEERRLFYVAMTRARKQLFLTYALTRLKYGSREYTAPSEFFDDIDERLVTAGAEHEYVIR